MEETLQMGELLLAGDIGLDIMSTSQIAEARRIFDKLDKDRDEKLNREELILAFRYFGRNPTNAELERMMDEVLNRNVPDLLRRKLSDDTILHP